MSKCPVRQMAARVATEEKETDRQKFCDFLLRISTLCNNLFKVTAGTFVFSSLSQLFYSRGAETCTIGELLISIGNSVLGLE